MAEETTEELSRVTTERDDFEKKANEATAKAETATKELTEYRQKQEVKNADADAKAFFDALDGKLFPFEREHAEPIMAASLAVRDSETPMKFAKGEETVDVADGIKALFEKRKDLPESLFTQVLETSDPKKPVAMEATVELDKLTTTYAKDNEVAYEVAVKAVRRENRDLADRADKENVPSTPAE